MRQILKRVLLHYHVLVLAVALVSSATATDAIAATIFESGTLGQTVISWQDSLDGLVAGSSVDAGVFSGVRFELMQPVVTTEIGGHFFSPSGGDFFGAIIQLGDESDFPNSEDLSTPDVLGTTLMTFPVASAEVFGDLNLSLDPGWYALVFSSGRFGASGNGGMVLNNPDIGIPSYIARQPGPGWFNLADISDAFKFVDFRFVVQGRVVPEPSAIALAVMAILMVFTARTPE